MCDIKHVILVWGALWLGVGLGAVGEAEAQVQKSGKATFRRSEHIDITVVRFPGNQFIWGGQLTAILQHEKGQGFGHNMGVSCAYGGNALDLKQGVFKPLMEGCVIRDRDGDAFFTESICSASSYDEPCGGKIVGGTGKYSGIKGTVHSILWPGTSNHFRRTCVESPKAEDCKPYFNSAFDVVPGVTYHLSGEQQEQVVIEWSIP